MRCPVAQVGDRNDPVVAELSLHTGIPLSDVRRLEMRRQDYLCVGQRERDVLAWRGQRKWIASGNRAPWITELIGAAGLGHLRTEGRILRDHAIRNESPYRVIEKSRAGAQRGFALAIRVVDEAKPRREVRELAMGKRVRDARVSVEERADGRIRINLADLVGVESGARKRTAAVVVVVNRQHRLPAQARVDHQPGRHVKRVLHVEPKYILTQIVELLAALAERI